MKTAGQVLARLWPLLPISGLLVLVWFTLHIRLPGPSAEVAPVPNRPSVGIVDPVVIRGTMLRDPTPLFLPTEFNNSRRDYVPPEPGRSFEGFAPTLTFAESSLKVHLPPPVAVPSSAAEALVGDPPGAPFLGFGRRDMNVEAIAPRGAYVEIVNAGTGRSVFARPVADAHPPSTVPWKPMEFMAAVDPAGLVGPLVQTVHSDVADTDAYFLRYLAETLRVGERLEPGFYRISVGP